jgi:hypothetical protein
MTRFASFLNKLGTLWLLSGTHIPKAAARETTVWMAPIDLCSGGEHKSQTFANTFLLSGGGPPPGARFMSKHGLPRTKKGNPKEIEANPYMGKCWG